MCEKGLDASGVTVSFGSRKYHNVRYDAMASRFACNDFIVCVSD